MFRRLCSQHALMLDESGQTMSEYAVTLGVIVLGVVLALGTLAVAVAGHLSGAASIITGIAP